MLSTTSNTRFLEAGANLVSDEKDFFDATISLEDSFKAKCIYVAIDCLEKAGWVTDENTNIQALSTHAKIFKLSFSPWKFIANTNKTRHSLAKWWNQEPNSKKEKDPTSFAQVLRNANDCVNPVWEFCDLMTKSILYLPKAAFETLKGINGGALILGMGWKACDSLSVISKPDYFNVSEEEYGNVCSAFEQGLMKLIQQVAYVALGVLTTLSVFFGCVFAPVIMTALSAITVVFTILPHYHAELGKPRTTS
jgi:hypothetical protein